MQKAVHIDILPNEILYHIMQYVVYHNPIKYSRHRSKCAKKIIAARKINTFIPPMMVCTRWYEIMESMKEKTFKMWYSEIYKIRIISGATYYKLVRELSKPPRNCCTFDATKTGRMGKKAIQRSKLAIKQCYCQTNVIIEPQQKKRLWSEAFHFSNKF